MLSTTAHLQGNEMIVLCEYPFVLDTRAKSVLMQFECVLKMKVREGGEGRGGEGRGGRMMIMTSGCKKIVPGK